MHEDLAGVDLKPEGGSLVPVWPIGGIYLMDRCAFSAACGVIPARHAPTTPVSPRDWPCVCEVGWAGSKVNGGVNAPRQGG